MGAFYYNQLTSVDETPTAPSEILLTQNYPNPFNASTTIHYSLFQKSQVEITIYDLLGRETGSINQGVQYAGTYQVTWDAENRPSGIYFYHIQAGKYTKTRKMVLIK
jgi:hypothetical protein